MRRLPRFAGCPRSARSFAAGAAAAKPQAKPKPPNGLSKVKSVLAVASGKGGVGKSSVCVNLAFTLQKYLGLKVGVMDADIYGPSLPSMVPPEVAEKVYGSKEGGIIPLRFQGVPLMSMGFMRPGQDAAVRGPMVSAMVQQMLTTTEWGELDYLLIDMPPGTGDIHITVAQQAALDAAIVVTTPQTLSLVDVEKGIRMFDKVKIPTLAIVENMSYFICDGCDKRHDVFQRGSCEQLAAQFGIERYFRFPLDQALSKHGMPFVLREEAHTTQSLAEFYRLATETVEAVPDLSKRFRPALRPEASGSLLILSSEDAEYAIPAREVLLQCRSAKMRDEFTGEPLFREEEIPSNVVAKKVSTAGRYAMNVDWSNGHNSLFPFTLLKEIASSHGQVWHSGST